ncbi:Transmembrane protein [Turdus rufiventris]|nr:Transmembrane protein [Turdus rufiventris]
MDQPAQPQLRQHRCRVDMKTGRPAAAEELSNVSTTEYEPPCLSVNFCSQAAMCCPSGMDDYGWIAAAVGWSLWFLTLILLCMDKIMKLRPDEPKYLVA